MMNRNCDNQETEWYNPGLQYISEKVYTGQTSLSIDHTVNESHCHTCLNQLEQSVVVVVGSLHPTQQPWQRNSGTGTDSKLYVANVLLFSYFCNKGA
jgi:hypothetical protein